MLYETPPKDFKPAFDAVSCFFRSNGDMLLLHRNLHLPQGGKWGMPGGKVHEGESLPHAMIRELREETDHKIHESDIQYFDSVYVSHPEHQFVYHMFSLVLKQKPDITIDPQEHQAFVWVSPQQALSSLNLVSDLDECIKRFYRISK